MPLEQDLETSKLITEPVIEEDTSVEEEKEELKPGELDHPWWDVTGGTGTKTFESFKNFSSKLIQNDVTGSDVGDLYGSVAHLASELLLPDFLHDTASLGSTKVISNAVRAITDARDGEYTDYAIGRGTDQFEEAAYKAQNHKPPSEMSDDKIIRNIDVPFIDVPFIDGEFSEKAGDEFRASFILNTIIALAATKGLPVLTSYGMANSALLRGVASKIPGSVKSLLSIDPRTAATPLGSIGRIFKANVFDEPFSTFLDDNTKVNILGFGAKPGMTLTEASFAAFPVNFAAVSAFAYLFNFVPISKALIDTDFKKILPSFKRSKKTETLTNAYRIARDQQKQAGIITEDNGGKTTFTKNVDPGTNVEKITQKPIQENDEIVRVKKEFEEHQKNMPPEVPEGERIVKGSEVDLGSNEGFNRSKSKMTQAYADRLLWERKNLDLLNKIEELESKIKAQKTTVQTPDSVAVHTTLDNFDNKQIEEVFKTEKNIPEVIEEISKRAGDGDQQLLKYSDVSAPTESLAITDINARIGQVPTDNLMSLANPKNGTELFDVISDATGKEFEEFTRVDVVNGIKKLEGEGRTLMPNRLMGMSYMNVNEIKLDPVRFQYKGGVDAQGVQKGQSLEGVEKWNNDAEGVVQVWEDPKDAKVYMVNGHNRLQKAKELGIPSVKIEFLDAPDAITARQQGALTNIAQGGGTPFDAANFLKESDITSPEQLTNIGVPLKSGLGAKGLALSKLPQNIYQDVLDGKISQNRGLLLGGSDLDEAGMQTAYKVLQKKDVTDATFSEVLQQAKNAPTAEGGQVDLFGNTEMLNLMIEKGQLAASIRKNLVQDRNLFRRAGQGADRLEAAGSKIDRFEAANQKNFAESAITQFDADKYADTNISKLLNEGAEQIAQGGKIGVVTRRIQPKIINEILNNPALPTKTPEIQTQLINELPSREVMINNIIKKAAMNGEVKPPTTPLIQTPKASDIRVSKVLKDLGKGIPSEDAKRLLKEELRLDSEFKQFDDAVNADRITEKRNKMGWDNMTYEQKKNKDFLKIMEESNKNFVRQTETDPINKLKKEIPSLSVDQLQAKKLELEKAGYPLTKRVAGNIQRKRNQFPYVETKQKAEQARLDLVSEENLNKIYKDGEEVGDLIFEAELKRIEELEANASNSLDPRLIGQAEYDLVLNELNNKTTQGFKLPNEFARMKPRYGLGEIQFDNDLDRVAYIIRSKAKKSAREDDIIAMLKQQGVDPEAARRHGSKVHQFVKNYVKEETGNAAANNAAGMVIKVPDQGFFEAPSMSFAPGVDFTGGTYNEANVRRSLELYKRRLKINQMDQLADYGQRIADDAEGILNQSKELAYEANKALKEAIRISGIEPEKVKFLDELNMDQMFSFEDNVRSTAQWRPDIATFMARNPSDPLSNMGVGQTSGIFVPPDYRGAMRGSIYLSLQGNLRRRLGGELSGVSKLGRRFFTDAGHEAFHAVQAMLNKLGDKRLVNALEKPEAIKEMISIIKRSQGNFQPGMNNKEIQAEAFGQWFSDRTVKLQDGGLKAVFERAKKYLNVFGRELRRILKKDPTYVDVFELAASGAIARKSKVNKLKPVQLEAMIGKMDAELDRSIPELTQRINDYLVTKKIEYENMLNGWNDSVAKGGCI